MTIKFFFKTPGSCKSWDWVLPRRENGTRLEGILTSCVSHPCILTGELLLPPRSRMRVMPLGRPFLPPSLLLIILLLLLLFLSLLLRSHSIICQKRHTLDVKVSFSISWSVLALMWMLKRTDEETKRIWANEWWKSMRESNTELGAQTRRLYYIERSISTSHQACIRNPFNFIQRTFFFDRDDRFHEVLSRSVVSDNNCWLSINLIIIWRWKNGRY